METKRTLVVEINDALVKSHNNNFVSNKELSLPYKNIRFTEEQIRL